MAGGGSFLAGHQGDLELERGHPHQLGILEVRHVLEDEILNFAHGETKMAPLGDERAHKAQTVASAIKAGVVPSPYPDEDTHLRTATSKAGNVEFDCKRLIDLHF